MHDPTRRTARPGTLIRRGPWAAFILIPLFAWSCGGPAADAGNGGGEGGTGQGEGVESAAGFPAAPSGPIDAALAARGAELFKSRGCVACHTFGGGRLVGPDLMGVTERRSFEWTYAMITKPDSMLANDADAKALLGEYYTPMPNQNVQADEALALYEHIRDKNDGGDAAVE